MRLSGIPDCRILSCKEFAGEIPDNLETREYIPGIKDSCYLVEIKVVTGKFLRSLGEQLFEVRRYFGISREDLSFFSGVHPNTLGHLERGDRDAALDSNTRAFMALGVNNIHLVRGDLTLTFNRDHLLGLREYPDISFQVYIIGQLIRNQRVSLGLTLEELSRMTSLHINTLWNIEQGLVAPRGGHLYAIYEALEIHTLALKGNTLHIQFL